MGDLAGDYLQAGPTLDTGLRTAGKAEFFHMNGAASDLSTFYVGTAYRLLPPAQDPRPSDEQINGIDRIYEVSGAGSDPALSLAAEVPARLTSGTCAVDQPHRVGALFASATGATLFYAAPLELSPGGACEIEPGESVPNKTALFARTGEAPPIEVSAPLAAQCHAPSPCATAAPAGVLYDGSSPDAGRAWFTTARPLVDSDADPAETQESADLYLARLQGGAVTGLLQASHGEPSDPTPGRGAGVLGVVSLSEDGDVVSFVATGVLTTEPNSAGTEALQGADNLYVYDAATGHTRFVAHLCSASERSGTLAEPRCPAGLTGTDGSTENDSVSWNFGHPAEAQATPDGRYLLFTSWGRLTPGDTDGVKDLYRYDLQTGRLTRLSFGRDGNDADGNDDAFPAAIAAPDGSVKRYEAAGDGTRAITADGALVVFQTAAPLVSGDTNQAPDVYEWEEQGHGTCAQDEDGSGGCVRLVSDGLDPHGTHGGVVSAAGADITFYTQRGEVPADTDGAGDIYDAREDGGFHYTPPPIPCGGGEACLGPVSPVPPSPKITTPEFVGPGNEPTQLKCAKGKVRVKKHGQTRCVARKSHKKGHKRHAKSNRGASK